MQYETCLSKCTLRERVRLQCRCELQPEVLRPLLNLVLRFRRAARPDLTPNRLHSSLKTDDSPPLQTAKERGECPAAFSKALKPNMILDRWRLAALRRNRRTSTEPRIVRDDSS